MTTPPAPPPDSAAETLVTVAAAGSPRKIRLRGPFEQVVGARSLEGLVCDSLDPDRLEELRSRNPRRYAQERQAAAEIGALLNADHRLWVGVSPPVEAEPGAPARDVVSPATRGHSDRRWYSLHLRVEPRASPRAIERQLFRQRVKALKERYGPKVAAIELSGLFRGHLSAIEPAPDSSP
jgi:hypothetical protein